jgi:hypothetical protein
MPLEMATSTTVKNQRLTLTPSSIRHRTDEEYYQETANPAAFPENAGFSPALNP